MSERTITEMYRSEMTEAIDELEIEEIEWHHSRWINYHSEEDRSTLLTRCLNLPWAIVKKDGIPKDFIDDCVQAGNLAILQSIETWKPSGGMAFTSWAWMYARRAMMAERTRLNEMYGFSEWEEEILGDGHTANEDNEELERDAQVSLIESLLAELSERQEEMMLCMLAGYTIPAAARQMGMSRVAAYRLHDRAVKKLRRLVGTKL